jgi:5-methylcytosine-specific restriction endonuclease McrA
MAGTWRPPPGWRKIRQAVFAMKGTSCWWCGRPATTIDHVIPVVLGGGHDHQNLVPACRRCNYSRGASTGNRIRSTTNPATWPSSRQW